MPNQHFSFTKTWKSSRLFLNHYLLAGNLKLQAISYNLKKVYKKIYGLFLWMGFNSLKVTEPLRRDSSLLFTTKSPGVLSQPRMHPVVLNLGPLDLEPSALTLEKFSRFSRKVTD